MKGDEPCVVSKPQEKKLDVAKQRALIMINGGQSMERMD